MALNLTDDELLAVRKKALKLAVRAFGVSFVTAGIVGAAKDFEAYLTRDDEESKDAR